MDANWERSKDIAPSVYAMPVGFITGSLDPVNLMMPGAAEAMAEVLPDFRGGTVVEGAGHWVQQEQPAATNAALAGFLASLCSALVALPAQPAGVAWPTEAWPEGRLPEGVEVELAPLLDEVFDPDGPLATTFAVVVVQGGRLLAERYAGALEHFDQPPTPVTADTPLLSWSMAKSVLHAAVGVLVGHGRLQLDAPAAVPEWSSPGDPRGAITLRQLLAMRDGLDWVEDYVDDRVSDVIKMLFGEGQDDMAHFAADRPLGAAPGTRFNYSSGTSNVISGIVARLVGPGEDYAALLARAGVRPHRHDERGPRVRCGRDLGGVVLPAGHRARWARFGLLYLRGGTWAGARLLPEGWVDDGRTMVSVDPDDGEPYGRTGGAWPATPWARSAPRATRGSRSPSARRSTWWWCVWAGRHWSARRTWCRGVPRWCRPSPGRARAPGVVTSLTS